MTPWERLRRRITRRRSGREGQRAGRTSEITPAGTGRGVMARFVDYREPFAQSVYMHIQGPLVPFQKMMTFTPSLHRGGFCFFARRSFAL